MSFACNNFWFFFSLSLSTWYEQFCRLKSIRLCGHKKNTTQTHLIIIHEMHDIVQNSIFSRMHAEFYSSRLVYEWFVFLFRELIRNSKHVWFPSHFTEIKKNGKRNKKEQKNQVRIQRSKIAATIAHWNVLVKVCTYTKKSFQIVCSLCLACWFIRF